MKIDIKSLGGQKVAATFKDFTVETDQPAYAGGEGSAPSPFQLFLASMGTCAGFYVFAFCQKRGIDPSRITLSQYLDVNPQSRMVETVHLNISLPDDFPEKYRSAVVNAAKSCTVKKHLEQPPAVEVKIA